MKSRLKEMKFNEELECWVVIWGDNSGYKMQCGEENVLNSTLVMEESSLVGWILDEIGILLDAMT